MSRAGSAAIRGLCVSLRPLPLSWNDCSQPKCNWTGITCDATGEVTQVLLHNRDMAGSLPPSIGLLGNASFFFLQGNKLTGTIPKEINQMGKLSYLYLNTNFLTGTVPDLSNLKNLVQVALYANQLGGQMPNFAGNTKLQVMYLMQNLFEGTIPERWSDLPDLRYMCVFFLPTQISFLPRSSINSIELIVITIRYFYSNLVSGTIPSIIFKLPKLIVLYVTAFLPPFLPSFLLSSLPCSQES
jgi:hypothetical protein